MAVNGQPGVMSNAASVELKGTQAAVGPAGARVDLVGPGARRPRRQHRDDHGQRHRSPHHRAQTTRTSCSRRDHAGLALEAELGHRRGVEREARAVLGRQLEPAGGEHAQDVAVGEERDVAAGGQRAGDHAVGALAGLRERLAAGRAVAPQRPAGPLLADLGRRAPLVVAVVDLGQVGVDLGLEAGERARSRAPAPRGEPSTSANSRPASRSPSRRAAARPRLGEREVGRRRVLAGRAPLRLAVAGQNDFIARTSARAPARRPRAA